MEVHHHSHTERKKWTHYLWEFLMLFLAVFCGFLAEYQLEHMIEHQREKEYMKSMLEDLAADTVMINSRIQFATRLVKGLDSLQRNLYSDSVFKKTITIYGQSGTYVRILNTPFNDQTAAQLRYSGNLRLIRKKEITNSISAYWNAINGIMMTKEFIDNRVDDVYQEAYDILNRKYLSQHVRDSTTGLDAFTVDPGASFMTTDKNKLAAYANRINRLAINIEIFYVAQMQLQKTRARNLIRLIKEQYKLN